MLCCKWVSIFLKQPSRKIQVLEEFIYKMKLVKCLNNDTYKKTQDKPNISNIARKTQLMRKACQLNGKKWVGVLIGFSVF